MNFVQKICMAVAGLSISVASQAGTISASLPEFSGNGLNVTQVVGTFNFTIPAGESVLSATINGTFGNSINSSTSVHGIYADGILMADCAAGEPCWQGGPTAWSYTFIGSDLDIFQDGSVLITTVQTDCCVVRQGALTLNAVTGAAVDVPEPASFALIGLGMAGLLAGRRQRRARQGS